jgi:hypothetical protein
MAESVVSYVFVNGAPLTQSVAHWSQNQPFKVEVAFDVDLEKLRAECDLHRERQVLFGVSVYSTHTKRKFATTSVAGEDAKSVTLALDSFDIGGVLEISPYVTVSSPIPVELGPSEAPDYAILWDALHTCELEGSSGRIPVGPADFTQWTGVHSKSLWRIVCDFPISTSDWMEAEINTCIEIKYNERSADAVHQQSVRALMASAYIERLIDAAVASEGLLESLKNSNDEELGSLALTVKRLKSTLFDQLDEEEIRRTWANDKDRISNKLQGMAQAQP